MEEAHKTVGGLLEMSGLCASSVASRAGVSRSTLHRILHGQVDPSLGTLQEIAIACGAKLDLVIRPLSDPCAAAAARSVLEEGYEPPAGTGLTAWQERLSRLAGSDEPIEIVKVAAEASSPLYRPGVALFSGAVPLARLASAGDASRGRWAVSGAAGLYLPSPSEAPPRVTILWCEDVRATTHLLADSDLRSTKRVDSATVALVAAEPELFAGSFSHGLIQYAAPIQIVLDCISQGGAVALDAIKEATSW